jgi:AcrR family transcriptional regulator
VGLKEGRADPDQERKTRRRGAALEDAILDAAWEQLVAEGYEGFTIDAVTIRAGTSKPVLYRRWDSRDDLLHAAVRHRGAQQLVQVPDTGSLRGDILALLALANRSGNGLVALLSANLADYFSDGGHSPAELRRTYLADRISGMQQIMDRAVARGEADPGKLTPRIIDLPFDLFRHEYLMTLRPVPDEVLREIVDDIFLPLVTVSA